MTPGPAGVPLGGVLVADFSRILAGPYATMAFADLGARVIKVERPGTGDDTRSWSPPVSESGSTYFDSVNRNKESIELDLFVEDDRELARQLCLRADVIVENFSPGTMQRHGLDYDSIRIHNPRAVYVSITGFGSAGGRHLPGYDFLVQAVGGLMSITGEEGSPTKVGVALVDVLTGKDVQVGVLAALFERHRTGLGSYLEVNLLSSLQSALVNQSQAFLGAGVVPGPTGNAHPSIAPYQLLDCGSGQLAIACGNDRQFATLCQLLGLAELIADDRFATNANRVTHRRDLAPLLEAALGARDPEDWARDLMRAGVPAGSISSIAQSIELASSLGLNPTIEVTSAGGSRRARQVRPPITWHPALPARTNAPPLLGEHNHAIRAWLSADPDTPASPEKNGPS